MAEMFQKSGRTAVEGCEVLRWRISLPLCESEQGRISAFYEEVGRRAAAFCEGALSERAKAEFERADDPNKRFSFAAFSYRLAGAVTYEDGELCSVCMTAELRRRGDRAPIELYEDGQVWEKHSGLWIPPKEVVFLCCGEALSRKEKRLIQGVLLSENSVLWYDGKAWNKKEFSNEFRRKKGE